MSQTSLLEKQWKGAETYHYLFCCCCGGGGFIQLTWKQNISSVLTRRRKLTRKRNACESEIFWSQFDMFVNCIML